MISKEEALKDLEKLLQNNKSYETTLGLMAYKNFEEYSRLKEFINTIYGEEKEFLESAKKLGKIYMEVQNYINAPTSSPSEVELLLQDFDNVVNRCDLGNIHTNKKTLLQLSDEIKRHIQEQQEEIKELELDWKVAIDNFNQLKAKLDKANNKIWCIQELLDFTPKDIRDVAVYTYEELNHILKGE